MKEVEAIKEEREKARYDEIVTEASEKLADAEKEITDAEAELEQGKAEAQEKLTAAREKLENAQKELEQAKKRTGIVSGEDCLIQRRTGAGTKRIKECLPGRLRQAKKN